MGRFFKKSYMMQRANTTYQFSQKSNEKLLTVDKRLRLVAHRCIDIIDFTVLEGRRSKERQNRLYEQGKSKVQWPESEHNVEEPDDLAKAIDIAPYPIDWEDHRRFYILGGVVLAIANETGIPIRWGGDWDGDKDLDDQSFDDLVHFEIEE